MITTIFMGFGLTLIFGFSMGVFFLVSGKKLFQLNEQNIFVRAGRTLYAKAGYIASFGAGALLVASMQIASNPYHFSHWTGMYNNAVLGEIITDNKTIMETGHIPEDVRQWYAARVDKF